MASGASLRNKITAVLRKTNVTSRVVKFRTVLSREGNALLGVGVIRANLDEVVDPQPVVESGTDWTGLTAPQIMAFGGNILQLGDYLMTFDGQVTESQLRTCDILYGDDLLKIINYNPIVFGGVIVGWQVFARTVKAS